VIPNSYRDIDVREIGVRGQEIGNFHRKSPGTDLDRPLVETRGGDRGVGSRDIDIPVDRRSGKSTLKTLTQIWAVHLREDSVIVHSGDPGTRHRYIDTREIGVPEVVKSRDIRSLENARSNLDRPSEEDAWQQSEPSGKVPTGSRLSAFWSSGYRESW
jgi:hypothetical protein